jgi:hypothetical protein
MGSFELAVLYVATPLESVATTGVVANEHDEVSQIASDEFVVTTAPLDVSRLTVNVVVRAVPTVAVDWGFVENATCVGVPDV